MSKLDPRTNAFREDLAAAALQSQVRAPKYSQGEIRQVAAPVIGIRGAPKFDAALATEALTGELLTVYDVRDGWAWVQLREDGYVGYTTLDGLSSLPERNTHRVSARLTYLYPAPDIKRPPITKLSFAATAAIVGRQEGRFFELSRGGFVFADHLVGIEERAKDFVRVAERFVGAPYLWGGKTTLGIDCSGLVQISLLAAGAACPRDSDMQADALGEAHDPANLDGIQRGDLLFWRGHVAIAQSADWMIHASGHHMEVVVEPIRRALERISESHGSLLVIKRISFEQVQQPPLQRQPLPQAQPQPPQGQAPQPQPKAQPQPPQGQAPQPQSKPQPQPPQPVPQGQPQPPQPQPQDSDIPKDAAKPEPVAAVKERPRARPVPPAPPAQPAKPAAAALPKADKPA